MDIDGLVEQIFSRPLPAEPIYVSFTSLHSASELAVALGCIAAKAAVKLIAEHDMLQTIDIVRKHMESFGVDLKLLAEQDFESQLQEFGKDLHDNVPGAVLQSGQIYVRTPVDHDKLYEFCQDQSARQRHLFVIYCHFKILQPMEVHHHFIDFGDKVVNFTLKHVQ